MDLSRFTVGLESRIDVPSTSDNVCGVSEIRQFFVGDRACQILVN